MPSSPARKTLLDRLIGVAERVIELAGDPDLRESIQRDRRTIRLAHERLLEAYAEIDERDREIGRLNEALADALRERDTPPPPSMRPVRHPDGCGCMSCRCHGL